MTAPSSQTDSAGNSPEFDELGQGVNPATSARLDTLLDMMLPVAIEFGRTTMSIQEVLDLGPGSVVQLDRMVGEPIDIYVSGRRLAEGEVVVVGEHFGVRVTKVLAQPRDAANRAANGNGSR
ncbi:MAG: flagellar motor switch protein FliN [Gemmatimonadota bacterium]